MTANVGGDCFGRHNSGNISAGWQIRILFSCARLRSLFHCNHY